MIDSTTNHSNSRKRKMQPPQQNWQLIAINWLFNSLLWPTVGATFRYAYIGHWSWRLDHRGSTTHTLSSRPLWRSATPSMSLRAELVSGAASLKFIRNAASELNQQFLDNNQEPYEPPRKQDQQEVSITQQKVRSSITTNFMNENAIPHVFEKRMAASLDALQMTIHNLRKNSTGADLLISKQVPLFPTARECNSALADLGNTGDLLRALRLFGKMRKSVVLQHKFTTTLKNLEVFRISQIPTLLVPAPTLVTYSTLMSRAVRASKPRVALRLWTLLLNDPARIVPDIRAVNILLNAHAKIPDLASARHVLHLMKNKQIRADIPVQLKANLVTYNTLLDACYRSNDLDTAMEIKSLLEKDGLQADALTYTTLIATVARGPSKISGKHDPTMAFSLLEEMKNREIAPNGMTYSALIDVAARCGRSDLALQGLRMMLRQKAQLAATRRRGSDDNNNYTFVFPNEVGAWTAAINACGKTGRIDTAIRLFDAMKSQRFEVTPNTITCGCLTDLLLKAGRTSEALDVLRFMKHHRIPPSEVMYTSLMARAERLVQLEQRRDLNRNIQNEYVTGKTKAIDVYTELMKSLIDVGESGPVKAHSRSQRSTMATAESIHTLRRNLDPKSLLLKVFLVFQQMKAAGASPDLACYNTLLRACARAGDVARARDVMRQLCAAGFKPNDTSWRQLLTAAATSRQSEIACSIWNEGHDYNNHASGLLRRADETKSLWNPSVDSFAAFLTAHLREATISETSELAMKIYKKILVFFDAALLGKESLNMHRLDIIKVLDCQRTMLIFLQAVVALDELYAKNRVEANRSKRSSLHKTAVTILQLECFCQSVRSGWAATQALQRVKLWQSESLD